MENYSCNKNKSGIHVVKNQGQFYVGVEGHLPRANLALPPPNGTWNTFWRPLVGWKGTPLPILDSPAVGARHSVLLAPQFDEGTILGCLTLPSVWVVSTSHPALRPYLEFDPMRNPDLTLGYWYFFEALANLSRLVGWTLLSFSGRRRCAPKSLCRNIA